MSELENWAVAELDSLGLPDAGVIVQYLGPLENPKEVEEYLSSMLDTSKSSHREFIKNFLERQAQSKIDKRFYRKSEIVDDGISRNVGKKNKTKGKNVGGNERPNNNSFERDKKSPNNNKKNDNNDADSEKENKNLDNDCKGPSAEVADSNDAQSQKPQGKKKKNKFVNLYTEDDVVMLSGRNVCECLASKHRLVNNCLSCGRIVCEQEGAGPCFFCGNIVKAKHYAQMAVPSEPVCDNKKNGKSKSTPLRDASTDTQKAIDHKNKLLEYDRTSERRTKVLDDECDYFNTNSKWISKEDKQVLEARELELKAEKYSKKNTKLTIDLFGRKVIEEDNQNCGVIDPDDPIIKAITERQRNDIFTGHERKNLPPPSSLIKPVYVSSTSEETSQKVVTPRPASDSKSGLNRIQDRELQEMSDHGKCLAMHQPWASLLVTGIKIHEGRTWYTSHRGRLWISSAAKVPTPEEIETMEDFYRGRAADSSTLEFPKHYPHGCLLGCVDVVDVLPQEEYRLKYPDGESDSPFVFICERPTEMIFKFPMKGDHKIFSLDKKIHSAAKKALKA